MKYIYNAIIILFIFSAQSCVTQGLETKESFLLGNWIEKHPIYGRTELIFIKGTQMIKKTAPNEGELSYSYRILNDTIELSSNVADEYASTKVFFKVTGNEMLIGNFLYNESSNEILRLKKK